MKKNDKIEIREIAINLLTPADYNPRRLSKKQYEDLKSSLERFGFVDPVLVNCNPTRKNVIIGGHQRVKVAADLGFKFVPCVFLDLDEDQERELNVRLNKNSGEWDFDALANYFDVPELVDWGFTPEELGGFGETVEDVVDADPGDGQKQIVITPAGNNQLNQVINWLKENEIEFKIKG